MTPTKMEWIKLDYGTMPTKEVLAGNFAKGTYGYKEKVMGYVNFDGQTFSCEGAELLENCTHYVDLSKFDIECDG